MQLTRLGSEPCGRARCQWPAGISNCGCWPASISGPSIVLMPGQESAWHTVRSAELWLYHRGSPVELHFGPDRDGAARTNRMAVPALRGPP